MQPVPHFSIAELWEFEEDARSSLLNVDGALEDPGHWLGLVIDTSRYCRELIAELDHERAIRLHGRDANTRYEFPGNWPSI